MTKKIEDQDWFVDINKVRTNYPRIENVKQFDADAPPIVPPHTEEYLDYWSWENKRCIEGFWGDEYGRHRFCPGKLRFMRNWGVMEHTTEDKVTSQIKPYLVDFLWEYAYISTIAYGFSGFKNDDKYSSDNIIKVYQDGRIGKNKLPDRVISKNGNVKEYVDPYQYLLSTHDTKMGRPLYWNQAQDVMVLGTRGSSKSYYVALAELEYNFVFNGARVYDKAYINGELNAKQLVGSADTNKSEELMQKVIFSQACKADYTSEKYIKWFGIWVEDEGSDEEDADFEPCPFYIRATGDHICNTVYKARYKRKINGQWKWKDSETQINHISYSLNKRNSATAGVGGRVLFSDTEEVGLIENYIAVRGANHNTTVRGGTKFGVQWGQGTSGNIEAIQETMEVYLDPKSFGVLSFENEFDDIGQDGRIGYFIPKYVTLFDHKDDNGNTLYEEAIDEVNRKRLEVSQSKNPQVMLDHLMNEPNYPREMFISPKGYYFPFRELETRQRQLLAGNSYKALAKPVDLIWDNHAERGVRYEINESLSPIINFPIPKDQKDWQGAPVIFEFPTPINGIIPSDMYITVHDPYVEEDLARGGSLGVTYIVKTDKYLQQTGTGNCIVAAYISKPREGLEHYYETQEKMIALYGNCPQSLFYEKARGQDCRAYYLKKNKLYLLAPTPQFAAGSSAYEQNVTSYGFTCSSRLEKLTMVKNASDWIKKTTVYPNIKSPDLGDPKLNVFRLPCLVAVNQMMRFDLDGNFDAVSAILGIPLALAELEQRVERNMRNENRSALSQLMAHPAMKRRADNYRKPRTRVATRRQKRKSIRL